MSVRGCRDAAKKERCTVLVALFQVGTPRLMEWE